MKKIVAYIASRKGKASSTYKFTKAILEKCKERDRKIEFELITSNTLTIHSCTGCEKCFTSGKCPLDKIDDGTKLKESFLSADMIIFGSPVYAHNVSGDMKTVIDRTSHWLHNMKLNRKFTAVISTTSNNGHFSVIRYLEKMMNLYGGKNLFKINCAHHYPDEFNNQEWFIQKTNELSQKIVDALNEPMSSDNVLESVFENLKKKYADMKISGEIIDNFKEAVEIGLCESETYQDFLNRYHHSL